MRIGIFSESYPPLVNGVSTSILVLQHALEKLGHDVYIVTVSEKKLKYEIEEDGKILRIPSINLYHCYDYKVTSVYPIKALNIIKKWNLDIIHSNVEFTIGMFARVVSVQLSIPLVHTAHTYWEDYTHYLSKNNKVLDKLWKEVVKYLSNFAWDKTVTELIVPSKKIYDVFKNKYKIEKNIHIVPTGLETDKFYNENFDKKEINDLRKKLGLKKKDFVILTVSRIAQEKSVDRLILNHKDLVQKYPNMKLLVVGDGPDLDKMKRLSDKLGINKNVIFTGKVPLDKVAKYYQLGNIFVTASQTETQGLTVIEAMGASLPIVAVHDDSFVNSIIDDLNGYLFKTDDEYIEYISKIYSDNNLYNRLSRESRIQSDNYSSEFFAQRVLKVYEVAIKNYKMNNKKMLNKIKRIVEKRKYKI